LSVESKIVQRLAARFTALRDAGRCQFGQEIRVLSWGHIGHGQKTIRPDFVVSFDDSPLIAIEVKGCLEKVADLGRALSQCDDYARARVGANDATILPPNWIGRPIWGAALAFHPKGSGPDVQAAVLVEEETGKARGAAHRLFGPRNVGFLAVEDRGLCLRVGGERWWREWAGWREDAFARGARVGSGRLDAPA
jgi:hypothetical protein